MAGVHMWLFKYQFRHKECKYSPIIKKLSIIMYAYPLNNYTLKGKFYVTAIHIAEGDKKGKNAYFDYLKRISVNVERINENSTLTLTVMTKNLEYYKKLYSPMFLFPSPVMHDGEKEYGEIASWDDAPLRELIKIMQKSKNTEFFRIIKLKNERLKEVFLFRLVPKLTEKQKNAFDLAINEGYYNYPRKINLRGLSKFMNISKSNYHEILRRAESNILKFLPK